MDGQIAFWGNPGDPVPEVDPEDLRAVFELYREAAAMSPDTKTIGIGVLARVCKARADTKAVWYRYSLLRFVVSLAKERFAPWIKDGVYADVVFREAAQMPMEWVSVGIPRNGLPFDGDELLRRLRDGEHRAT